MSDTPNNGYDWLTLAEACQTLDISERTLHRYIKQGKYESKIEKGRRLIRLSINEVESIDVRPEGEDLAEHLSTEVQYLRQQLSERDRQVQTLTDELRQLNERAADTSKRHDTIVLTLTQQLDKAHLQLEDLRTEQSQSWWRRVLMRKPLT